MTDKMGDITTSNVDHKLQNVPNNDGTAQGKTLAENNPGLDNVGAVNREGAATATDITGHETDTVGVKNATQEGDIAEGPNPNHDIDPYMNQSNANHPQQGEGFRTPSYDNEQKGQDAAGPGPLPAVPTDKFDRANDGTNRLDNTRDNGRD